MTFDEMLSLSQGSCQPSWTSTMSQTPLDSSLDTSHALLCRWTLLGPCLKLWTLVFEENNLPALSYKCEAEHRSEPILYL